MNELINQLNIFFGNKAIRIKAIGPAEINVVLKEEENFVKLSEDLQNHIVEIVAENTLAKINILDLKGKVLESFALNR